MRFSIHIHYYTNNELINPFPSDLINTFTILRFNYSNMLFIGYENRKQRFSFFSNNILLNLNLFKFNSGCYINAMY